MRSMIALILVIYLVGVGVVLAPTINAKWNNATAADLSARVTQQLPNAMAWPVIVYHRVADTPAQQAAGT
jgi:hypothetical protein